MKRISSLASAAVVLGAIVLAAVPSESRAGFVVFQADGAGPAGIQSTVDNYRAALGTLNANTPGSVGSGRREINWDGVPASSSDPISFAANFFNANIDGRARGIELSTPGTGFLVSAAAGGSTPTVFGFPTNFIPFSAQKLFSPVNSVITDIRFFVPGSSTVATVGGFGAVFNDVEVDGATRLEAFDLQGQALYSGSVPVGGRGSLAFLGILATSGERIARIRLTSGSVALISNGAFNTPFGDFVVMDDFIYAEPLAATPAAVVPVPASALLLGCGLLSLAGIGWKDRSKSRVAG